MLSVGSRNDMAYSKAYHRKVSERFPSIQHLGFAAVLSIGPMSISALADGVATVSECFGVLSLGSTSISALADGFATAPSTLFL
jgi:hypothetical protein